MEIVPGNSGVPRALAPAIEPEPGPFGNGGVDRQLLPTKNGGKALFVGAGACWHCQKSAEEFGLLDSSADLGDTDT
eukprot:2860140-Rhodomonas_salina.1